MFKSKREKKERFKGKLNDKTTARTHWTLSSETIENEEEWWTEEIKRLNFNRRNVRIFSYKMFISSFIPMLCRTHWNGCENVVWEIVFALAASRIIERVLNGWVHSYAFSQKKMESNLRKGDSSLLNGFHFFLTSFISQLHLNRIDMRERINRTKWCIYTISYV